MPIRFHRSIKIMPGVKLNLSKSGVSTTVGPRGVHFTFSKRGIRRSIGIPGTGLSEVDYIKKNGTATEQEKREVAEERREKNAEESPGAREQTRTAVSEPGHDSRRTPGREGPKARSSSLRNALVLFSILIFFVAGAEVLGLVPAHFFSNSLQYIAHLVQSTAH